MSISFLQAATKNRESGNLEDLIRGVCSAWKYPPHALRSINLEAVNQLFLDKFCELSLLETFEEGRLEVAKMDVGVGSIICGVRKLPWDTGFFGFPIGRLEPLINPYTGDLSPEAFANTSELVESAVDFAREEGLRHLIASADPSDVVSINALEAAGFRLKDTMNFHVFDMKKVNLEFGEIRGRQADFGDLDALESITRRCFSSRRYVTTRFGNDPVYASDKVAEMYFTWLKKSITGEIPGAAILVEQKGKPVGYLTTILPNEKEYALGIPLGDMGVGAVDPDFHGKGTFSILLNEVLGWFKEREIRHVLCRTAISTIGVNKNCSRLGSFVPCSPHTFHLNIK